LIFNKLEVIYTKRGQPRGHFVFYWLCVNLIKQAVNLEHLLGMLDAHGGRAKLIYLFDSQTNPKFV